MPASRSRTERWKELLQQLHDRGGALEIAVKADPDRVDHRSDLVWRVRLLAITADELLVEYPSAAGRSISLGANVPIVAALSVGQNRWMFTTESRGVRVLGQGHAAVSGLVLKQPTEIERCSRRQFFRISTAELRLPSVECWPLLDPATAIAAETANRLAIEDRLARDGIVQPDSELAATADSLLLPDVGPSFNAKLLNLSGGGMGLLIDPGQAGKLDRVRYLWLRIDLRPEIPAPVALTAKLVHEHRDSSQHVFAGLCFDFAHHPAHQRFVVDLLAHYVNQLQQNRGAREAA
mgnify:CR=1 FL=1